MTQCAGDISNKIHEQGVWECIMCWLLPVPNLSKSVPCSTMFYVTLFNVFMFQHCTESLKLTKEYKMSNKFKLSQRMYFKMITQKVLCAPPYNPCRWVSLKSVGILSQQVLLWKSSLLCLKCLMYKSSTKQGSCSSDSLVSKNCEQVCFR